MDPALIMAVAALVTAVGASVIGPIRDLRKARIERQPTEADKTNANVASNDLILKLLDRAEKQADRDAKTIERQNSTIESLETAIRAAKDDDAKAALSRALRAAEVEKAEAVTARDVAQDEAKRLRLAIMRLRELAAAGAVFTGGDVIVWANNALDLDVPLSELLHLPEDFDDTIIPAT